MIYIIRHQEGNGLSNCLTQDGIEACVRIAKKLKTMKKLEIYTFPPLMNGHHVRVIQTASLIGSHLKKFISLIDLFSCPNYSDDVDILIVTHHSQMHDILSKYAENTFVWPYQNYDGCLVVSKNSWTFDSTFLRSKTNKIVRKLREFMKRFVWFRSGKNKITYL